VLPPRPPTPARTRGITRHAAQEKRYRSMQEHIRRAHPEHYISKLPATEESFMLMVNTPPQERPPPPPLPTTTGPPGWCPGLSSTAGTDTMARLRWQRAQCLLPRRLRLEHPQIVRRDAPRLIAARCECSSGPGLAAQPPRRLRLGLGSGESSMAALRHDPRANVALVVGSDVRTGFEELPTPRALRAHHHGTSHHPD